MTEANLITGFNVGQYGEAIPLTIIDDYGNSVNISSYTGTKNIILQSPDSLKVITYAASFVNTGTDGNISFTPAQGDIDRSGDWNGQVTLSTASATNKTVLFIFRVGDSLS